MWRSVLLVLRSSCGGRAPPSLANGRREAATRPLCCSGKDSRDTALAAVFSDGDYLSEHGVVRQRAASIARAAFGIARLIGLNLLTRGGWPYPTDESRSSPISLMLGASWPTERIGVDRQALDVINVLAVDPPAAGAAKRSLCRPGCQLEAVREIAPRITRAVHVGIVRVVLEPDWARPSGGLVVLRQHRFPLLDAETFGRRLRGRPFGLPDWPGLNRVSLLMPRLMELAQKMDRRGAEPEREMKSWGEQFVHAEGLKVFADEVSRPSRFRMELKTTITTGSTSGGPTAPAPYRDAILPMPTRQLHVRDLLPKVQITSGSVEYPEQTTRTNAANTVAETITKPESAYGFTMRTVTPSVIAHWVPASRQTLEDAPQLRDIIDTELRYGLELKEDAQLLNGDGTGDNLSGLITNATAYSAPITLTGPTMIDQIGLGLLQTTLADFTPTGIVLHPSDWMRIRLLKDTDGNYLLGDPGAAVPPVLFGLPVVATTSMSVDKFLIGDFQRAATLYDRWLPRVEVSTEHADFFVRNMVAILAEQRLALAVKNATALTYGDFGNVA